MHFISIHKDWTLKPSRSSAECRCHHSSYDLGSCLDRLLPHSHPSGCSLFFIGAQCLRKCQFLTRACVPSRVQLFATLRTIARQTPLSMGFSRQEYWSGLPCPPPGDLPNAGIEPASLVAPALQADSLLLSHQGSLLRRDRVDILHRLPCLLPCSRLSSFRCFSPSGQSAGTS